MAKASTRQRDTIASGTIPVDIIIFGGKPRQSIQEQNGARRGERIRRVSNLRDAVQSTQAIHRITLRFDPTETIHRQYLDENHTNTVDEVFSSQRSKRRSQSVLTSTTAIAFSEFPHRPQAEMRLRYTASSPAGTFSRMASSASKATIRAGGRGRVVRPNRHIVGVERAGRKMNRRQMERKHPHATFRMTNGTRNDERIGHDSLAPARSILIPDVPALLVFPQAPQCSNDSGCLQSTPASSVWHGLEKYAGRYMRFCNLARNFTGNLQDSARPGGKTLNQCRAVFTRTFPWYKTIARPPHSGPQPHQRGR